LDGFDVLTFLDAGNAKAWVEEETPEVAADTLEARGVRMIPIS
jgi:hypothetical protein